MESAQDLAGASPAVCTLPMVPCGSSPVTRFALASAMQKTKRLRRRLQFHSKMAWPPATYDVVSGSHSNRPSLIFSFKMRARDKPIATENGRCWCLGKNFKKLQGGCPSLYVRGLWKNSVNTPKTKNIFHPGKYLTENRGEKERYESKYNTEPSNSS